MVSMGNELKNSLTQYPDDADQAKDGYNRDQSHRLGGTEFFQGTDQWCNEFHLLLLQRGFGRTPTVWPDLKTTFERFPPRTDFTRNTLNRSEPGYPQRTGI